MLLPQRFIQKNSQKFQNLDYVAPMLVNFKQQIDDFNENTKLDAIAQF